MRGLVGAALLVIAGSAGASTVSPVTAKCPVGGKSFTYMGYMSYSRWGALLDGQPVGSAAFPIKLPQCPDNGLVLYDEFDATTVKRLTPRAPSAMQRHSLPALPPCRNEPASLDAIALRARSANALRELGRFAEAEQLRAGIVVPASDGRSEDEARNLAGWRTYLEELQPVIARGDASRVPST